MPNLLGRLQTLLFGAAVGRASSEAITPVLEPVRQHAWTKNQVKVLDPATAAEASARGIISETDAEDDASRGGVNVSRFGALLRMAQEYPGEGLLARMRRRKLIVPADVTEALTRHGIPEKYHGAIVGLFDELLSPGELAAAIHRGLIPDPANPATGEPLLRGEQPVGPFKVEAYPVYPIDAAKEAEGSGYDVDRLGVLVGLQGLPMGTHEAAEAYFRGVITHGDYIRAFNESNSRNEWAAAVMEYSRQIPTARDYLENALRGYRTLDEAITGAERHGMTKEDATLIYQNQGRPMNIRQITMALARGARFHPEPGEITDPYRASTVEGPIKPAYYEMFESLKYTLPSVFTMRSLAESGVWDEAKTAERLKWAGWFPQDADEAAAAWTKTTTVDPHVGKAQTQLWTALHKAFVSGRIDSATASSYLTNLIDNAADRAVVVGLWETEANIASRTGPPA